MPFPLIPLLIGAGLGAISGAANKKKQAQNDAFRKAAITYSPWTGMGDPGTTNLSGPLTGAIQGGAQGAMFGSMGGFGGGASAAASKALPANPIPVNQQIAPQAEIGGLTSEAGELSGADFKKLGIAPTKYANMGTEMGAAAGGLENPLGNQMKSLQDVMKWQMMMQVMKQMQGNG